MLDLIAVTIGTLTFIAWSAVLMFGGYAYRRKIERREQRKRIAQWLAETRAKQAPAKVEPRYPAASAETRKRAQA